ncbi:MAG: Gfo/Idh/MocA family oxidoreductase [Prolixibacteraceae bacterium]
MKPTTTRRQFIAASGTIAAGMLLSSESAAAFLKQNQLKKRIALVGTGVRGMKFWAEFVLKNYSDVVQFVALSDINEGRLKYAKEYLKLDVPVYTNFDQMLDDVEIDLLFVTTVDATHDEFIIKALNRGLNVLTEKPMTTDEVKCQNIISATKNSSGNMIMGFNYRYGKIFTRLKQMLHNKEIGEVTSVDFHWYLNTYHGASYFRRWHGLREKSGTLLLHKASHHFDLLNWWIGSDPVEVHALGSLDYYGKNNSFRGKRCMECPHTASCKFFWDIKKDEESYNLYVKNEKYDGYIRDNCLFREEIDIFDKMALQIKYANGVQVSYSLTTYSPYEGFRIAFNGKEGRLETWEGIPSMDEVEVDQGQIHEKEMDHTSHTKEEMAYHEIIKQINFADFERIKVPYIRKGHWGGDTTMVDQILRGIDRNPELHHAANFRDGSMAILIGVAARKSIDEGRSIKIADLTELVPKINKWG